MSGQVRLGAVSCTLLAATALVLGCGGQSAREENDTTGGRTARGGSGGFAWAGGGRGGNGGTTPTGGRLTSDFVDPGCPDPPPPEQVLECDPLGDSKDCPLGFGCYPFVTHPSGDGCEPRIFGATCRSAGAGSQGSVCGSEPMAARLASCASWASSRADAARRSAPTSTTPRPAVAG